MKQTHVVCLSDLKDSLQSHVVSEFHKFSTRNQLEETDYLGKFVLEEPTAPTKTAKEVYHDRKAGGKKFIC